MYVPCFLYMFFFEFHDYGREFWSILHILPQRDWRRPSRSRLQNEDENCSSTTRESTGGKGSLEW